LRKNQTPTPETLRERVAVEAAGILYRREEKEYLHAKREAARRHGTTQLPSNVEVQSHLLRIARQLEGAEHGQRLRAMRVQAALLMHDLREFAPRLIGSVLTGHARSGSDIDLHLYTEDAEAVCRALRAQGHDPLVERVVGSKDGQSMEFTHVRVAGEFPVEITLYPRQWLTRPLQCGISGGPLPRASLEDVRGLLSAGEPEPVVPLPVSPEDLVEEFGALSPREVGRLWERLLAEHSRAKWSTREEGLSLASELLAEE
jgi:hypothetical protein